MGLSTVKGVLDWSKRAKCDETLIAKRRIWRSRCGRYAVVESVPTLRPAAVRDGGLDQLVYSVRVLGNGNQELIGRYRTKSAAVAGCESDATRKGQGNV